GVPPPRVERRPKLGGGLGGGPTLPREPGEGVMGEAERAPLPGPLRHRGRGLEVAGGGRLPPAARGLPEPQGGVPRHSTACSSSAYPSASKATARAWSSLP